MIFSIDITERLVRTISIEADTVDEALDKVRQLYKNTEIVLDSSDFSHVEFSITTSSQLTIKD